MLSLCENNRHPDRSRTGCGTQADLQQAIAEFSLDHVMVAESTTATHDPFAESAAAIQWFELEIEAAPGGEAQAFTALVRTVKAALTVSPSPGSKLEQALQQLHAVEANGRIQPHTAMTEACRALSREQLLRMLAAEAGVRFSADPEYVHQMRVATRPPGSRSALRPFFRPKAIRRYLQGLRQTARLLGAVRDLDVAIDKLTRFQAKAKERSIVGLPPVLEHWRGAACCGPFGLAGVARQPAL